VLPAAGLALRPAGPDDVVAVVGLVESAYRGDSSRAGWTSEAHLLGGQRTDESEIAGLIAREDSLVLVAEMDGRLVGCCHLERRPGDVAYLGLLAVQPSQQGSGIGRTVVDEAERIAAAWGGTQLEMTVIRQREDLIAWYRRLGYEETGESRPFPYGDERFGEPRRDDLEFVVLARPLTGK
jgi:ribosomal protein S18 acetylase RimI-like enzyme